MRTGLRTTCFTLSLLSSSKQIQHLGNVTFLVGMWGNFSRYNGRFTRAAPRGKKCHKILKVANIFQFEISLNFCETFLVSWRNLLFSLSTLVKSQNGAAALLLGRRPHHLAHVREPLEVVRGRLLLLRQRRRRLRRRHHLRRVRREVGVVLQGQEFSQTQGL